jgi:hypothetical protein
MSCGGPATRRKRIVSHPVAAVFVIRPLRFPRFGRDGLGDVAHQLPFPTGPRLGLADRSGFPTWLDEPPADPLNGNEASADRLGEPLGVPSRAAGGGVGLERDAGVA